MLLYFVLLLENVFYSQYIPYVSYFHIYVFLFCDAELYMLKFNKTSVLFCSVLFCSVTNLRVQDIFFLSSLIQFVMEMYQTN